MHDSAAIHHCAYCASLFLEYRVQIYDDNWIHWIPINKEECNTLEHLRKIPDPQNEIVDFIMSKPKLVSLYPSDKLIMRAPFIMHLNGAPW